MAVKKYGSIERIVDNIGDKGKHANTNTHPYANTLHR